MHDPVYRFDFSLRVFDKKIYFQVFGSLLGITVDVSAQSNRTKCQSIPLGILKWFIRCDY